MDVDENGKPVWIQIARKASNTVSLAHLDLECLSLSILGRHREELEAVKKEGLDSK
jgi:hypothetical protein